MAFPFIFGSIAGGTLIFGHFTNWEFQLKAKTSVSNKVILDYHQVREEIEHILPQPGYDDGSIAPLLVRLAWHAAGTYDAKSKTGGSNGATMRFKPELSDGANAGLDKAQKFLEPIKQKFPQITYADLWILASYVAIEEMGGPKLDFLEGRKDSTEEKDCPPNGRLPDATKGAQHIRDVFGRMGFSDREMVALIGGGHTIGRCHKDRSGFDGPWTNSPLTMSNQFFKVLLDQDWKPKTVSTGNKQFEDKTGRLMMLPTDLELKTDKNFRKWSDLYKNDQDQFLRDFGESFKKLTELGFKRF